MLFFAFHTKHFCGAKVRLFLHSAKCFCEKIKFFFKVVISPVQSRKKFVTLHSEKMYVMKRILCSFVLMYVAFAVAMAVEVKTVRVAGPFEFKQPVVIDSLDATQVNVKDLPLVDVSVSLETVKNGTMRQLSELRGGNGSQIVLAGFRFACERFAKADIKVGNISKYKVFVNGEAWNDKRSLQPGTYDVVVKFVIDTVAPVINVEGDGVALVEKNGKRPFSIIDNMLMKNITKAVLSHSGKYAIKVVSGFTPDGKTESLAEVIETTTGRRVAECCPHAVWMPGRDLYFDMRYVDDRRELTTIDPKDMTVTVICRDLKSESWQMSPTGDFVILTEEMEGPAPDKDVHEIKEPDDRIPGWRTRSRLLKVDLKTSFAQPLTHGYHTVNLMDISNDGRYILYNVTKSVMGKRPTEVMSIYRLELATMSNEAVVENDGFVSGACFVPGGEQIILTGSPECLGGVGNILSADKIPSMYDYQIYLMERPGGSVRSLTRDFKPAVQNLMVNEKDGMVYFTAENEDSVSLYRLNLKNGNIEMLRQPVEVVNGFDVKNNTLLYYGTSACVPSRLFTLDTKSGKARLLADPNVGRMLEIALGECRAWRMTSVNGYEITGHCYYPADFDSTRRYPVIVSYYGGCSPTSRRFGGGSHYPAHYWNANGYIVFEVNPGGATGFGQEWSARHVNTMGESIAEDIIEATKWFSQNKYVAADKIGCVSASYGGFMTQLLLTKTDIFATGISHAGISDHTSYWGEGYWGYTYSQVCAANSYPWTRKDLFVDRSPLYNADKIHKPLLFTHGSADTNVPIGESIQMYNALKLLGVPTAFVVVEGENHGIMAYSKRIKWINTMMAWFQKWLKDDDSWWRGMYGDDKL